MIGGWFRFVVLMVIGFTLLSTTPVMLALVQEHAKKKIHPRPNGFFMMTSFMARSGTVVLVGLMGDTLGLKAAFIISGLLGPVESTINKEASCEPCYD